MFKKKKRKLLSLMLFMSIFILSTSINTVASANTSQYSYKIENRSEIYTYEVIKIFTNIRKGPSSKSRVLGVLKRGEIVTALEVSNGWCKINYKNTIGYVNLRDLEQVVNEEEPNLNIGSVTIKYLDSETKEEILATESYKDLELKQYQYNAKSIEGYTILGDLVQTVVLNKENPSATVEFLYVKDRSDEMPETNNAIKGIFSWKNAQCLKVNREDTYHWIDKLQLNEIYQSGLFKIPEDERISFVRDLKVNKNVDVYALTGDPSWYNSVSSFKTRIDQVKNHNAMVSEEARIKGVVFDVEPWVLGSGNWSQEVYANTIKEAYRYAKEVNVKMVMVIPFWLDVINSDVIIQNSDKTIVMNYNITAPVKFIKEEIELAKKYNKKISTAAETKKIDSQYGVNEKTTYYYVGVERLNSDWEAIANTYQYDGLEFSYHDFESIKEFIK